MSLRLTRVKALAAVVLSIALLAVLACAADEPPAPSITTSDVQAAVKSAMAGAPATSAEDIKKMVESAMMASPGVSKADIEAVIKAQAGTQISAEDVKRVVDASIRAMPSPKVDPESIRPLIQNAVASAVPEGTSPEQIRTMVMAAVTASTANVPTRGELEDSIAKAVKDSAKGQLTAAEVQRIVDASVEVMAAQVRMDLNEVRGSVEAMATLPTPTTMGARVDFSRVVFEPYMKNFASFIKRDPSRTLIKDQTLYTVENGRVDNMRCGAQYLTGWFCLSAIKVKKDGSLAEGLAVSYEVDQAGLTYVLNLHPDAVFQNGEPFTARDLKEGWEWISMPENRPDGRLGIAGITQQIEGMDGVISGDRLDSSGLIPLDDHTLEIRLAKFDPLWPLKMSNTGLGSFSISHIEDNPDSWWKDQVGTGPFKLQFQPDTGEANWFVTDNWWGDQPIIKHVQMLGSNDLQSQYILYENGEADIIQASLPYQPQIHDPGHKFFNDLYHHFVGGFWQFIFRNKPPFDDVKVREAFIRAIDIDSVVKAVETQAAEPAAGIIVRGVRCNDPAVQGVKGYDPARARELLAESSYGSAANLPPSLIEVARPNFIREFEIYQQMWKDNLGVTVGLTRLQPGMDRSPDANMSRSSVGTGYNDPARIIRNMGHSTGYYQGVSGFGDPELDAMVELAESYTLQDPERCKAYRAAEDRIIENFWHVPLFLFVGSQAARSWVNDYDVIESPYPWMSISPRNGAREGQN
jgi:oligopeptide transport system substrate-binding protein